MVKHNELISVDADFFESRIWKTCADIDGRYQWMVERLICSFMKKYRKEIEAAERAENPAEWKAAEIQVWKIFWVNPAIAIRIVEESSLYKVVNIHAAMKTVYYALSEKFGYMKNRILNKRDKFILLIVESCFSNTVRGDSRIDVMQYLKIAYNRKYKGDRLLNRYTFHHIYTHIPPQRIIFLITWLWDKYCYEKSLVRRDRKGNIIETEKRPLQYLEYVLAEAQEDNLWEVCEYEEEYAKFVHSVIADGEHLEFLEKVLGNNDLENKISRLQELYVQSGLYENDFNEIVLDAADEDNMYASDSMISTNDNEERRMYGWLFRERAIISSRMLEMFTQWLGSTEVWHEWVKSKEIICPETKNLVAYHIYENASVKKRQKLLPYILRHPVDVLRYALKISDPEYPNPYFQGKIKIKLKNQERLEIMRLLDHCADLYEGIWHHPNQFKLLMRMTHVNPNQIPPRVAQAFNNLYNNRKVDENGNRLKTPNAICEEMRIECGAGNIDAVKEFARQHPEVFFPNMFRFVDLASEYERELEIVDLIRELGATMKPGVIFKIANNARLRNILNWRIAYIKESDKYMRYEMDVKKFDRKVLERIEENCMYASISYFQGRESIGKVYVDPALFQILFPRRITTKTFRGQTYTFGSYIELEDIEVIRRICIKWRGPSDVDLHMEFYNEELEQVGGCGYEEMNSCVGDVIFARHSGDMQPFIECDAENVEFIDINFRRMQEAGVKYFTITVNVMNVTNLWEVKDIRLEIYEFAGTLAVENMPVDAKLILSADMKSETQHCVTLVCDVAERKVVWIERPLERQKYSLERTQMEIWDALYCPNAKMGQIFTAYAMANGQLTEKLQEADTIFTARELSDKDEIKENAEVIYINNWSYILENFVE